jgi:hypothetical protein
VYSNTDRYLRKRTKVETKKPNSNENEESKMTTKYTLTKNKIEGGNPVITRISCQTNLATLRNMYVM